MPRRGPLLHLSREHHGALLLARDCRRIGDDHGSDAIAAMNARIADYWRQEMATHFALEERLLAEHPGSLPVADHERLLIDHRLLEDACASAEANALDAEALRAFGERLVAHVRFEERNWYVPLQGMLAVDRE